MVSNRDKPKTLVYLYTHKQRSGVFLKKIFTLEGVLLNALALITVKSVCQPNSKEKSVFLKIPTYVSRIGSLK